MNTNTPEVRILRSLTDMCFMQYLVARRHLNEAQRFAPDDTVLQDRLQATVADTEATYRDAERQLHEALGW